MNARLHGYRERLNTLVSEDVWQLELADLTRSRRVLYQQLRILYIVAHGFTENRLTIQAAALTFSMLLSIAPFFAVSFSVLKAFGVHNQLQPMLAELLAPLGPKGGEITTHLITFVNNVHVGALGAVGLVTLFLTIVSLIGNIEQAFNRIWGVKAPRRLARKFSDYLSVLLVGPVLVFSGLGIIASLQSSTLVQWLIAIEPIGTMILTGLKLMPYLMLWGAFTFMYIFLPNMTVKLGSALMGGLVAAILWVTAGWGFAGFVASSTKYTAIYSGFAILFLFLLWLYVGWIIVLFGAEVAFAHQHLHAYLGGRRASEASIVERERLALQVMLLIGQHFLVGEPAWSADGLAKRMNAPVRLVTDVLHILAKKRLLLPASNGQIYVPARDLEHISVKEIFDTFRNAGESGVVPVRGDHHDVIDAVIQDVDRAVTTSLHGKSLKTLVQSQDLPNPPRTDGRHSPRTG
jgi:membrane protein